MKLLALVVSLLALMACQPTPSGGASGSQPAPSPKLAQLAVPSNQNVFYTSGTAATYTVPAGAYVTGLTAHATGAGAYLTIEPEGLGVIDASVGSQIPIPPGVGFELGRPVLVGSLYELGPGSVLTFSGTDSYAVFLVQAR